MRRNRACEPRSPSSTRASSCSRDATEYADAYRDFRWPRLDRFNWALDWFDAYGAGNDRPALWLVADDAPRRAAHVRRALRAEQPGRQRAPPPRRARGDRLLLMLPNVVAALGGDARGHEAGRRGGAGHAAAQPRRPGRPHRARRDPPRRDATRRAREARRPGRRLTRIVVGGRPAGWSRFEDGLRRARRIRARRRDARRPIRCCSTSRPAPRRSRSSCCTRTRATRSGHLSTMYWIGLREGDVHWNISSPGWAKHAWSSLFAPWNAGATVFVLSTTRASSRAARSTRIVRCGVTTLCAPPTVWRMLVGEDLGALAGRAPRGGRRRRAAQPRGDRARAARLGPHDSRRLRADRDHGADRQPAGPAGQARLDGPAAARATASCCSTPPAARRTRARSRSPLDPPPLGLMAGYLGRREPHAPTRSRGGYYRTGDVAERDADGYITYVGRADDVFKSSDYRISPFELESALVEHPHVAEAAVVPSPDPVRLARAEGVRRARRATRRRRASWRWSCSASCATGCRATSAYDASSSPSCRRPSRARSAGSTCARSRPAGGRTASGWSSSSGRRIFRSSAAALELKRLLDPAQHELHGTATSLSRWASRSVSCCTSRSSRRRNSPAEVVRDRLGQAELAGLAGPGELVRRMARAPVAPPRKPTAARGSRPPPARGPPVHGRSHESARRRPTRRSGAAPARRAPPSTGRPLGTSVSRREAIVASVIGRGYYRSAASATGSHGQATPLGDTDRAVHFHHARGPHVAER